MIQNIFWQYMINLSELLVLKLVKNIIFVKVHTWNEMLSKTETAMIQACQAKISYEEFFMQFVVKIVMGPEWIVNKFLNQTTNWF